MNNILIVEDQIVIADGVEEAFRDSGMQACSAHSGGEALRRLEAEPRGFAVLVTDINLGPGADGFEVAARARKLNPEIRIVYITGRRENLDAVEDEALICLKPFDAEDLAHRVNGILHPASPLQNS
jgi:two-component system cell cycle response regulator CpdR